MSAISATAAFRQFYQALLNPPAPAPRGKIRLGRLAIRSKRPRYCGLQRSRLVQRYAALPGWPSLSYATVRDYCDSADHFPRLATLQGDLKDVQRPWAVKAILNHLPPGSRLLEVGSGEPHAAAALADLGYRVTVCDPFDGSGRGPTAYKQTVTR